MIRAGALSGALAALFCSASLVVADAAPSAAPPRVRFEVHLSAADRARAAPLVTVDVTDAPSPLSLVFPAWLPGAYELRFFGRDVREVSARTETGEALRVTRASPTRIVVSGHAKGAAIHVTYRTSAELFSDDGADVSTEHAYFNPGAIVPQIVGLENEPQALSLEDLPPEWKVIGAQATTGRGRFSADGYGRLVDGPIEASGHLSIAEEVIEGARFTVALDREGATATREVPQRLIADLRKIVAAERAIAGPLPFERYLMLIHLSDRPTRTVALEHAASTSILAPPSMLDGDSYAEMRHMMSHELFHAWNARRLIPAELVHWDPERPQPSRALWITEGLTEHASLAALTRAGLCARPQLTLLLAEALSRAQRAEHARLSLEEQALLAFAAPTSMASDPDAYYAIGHVVSLALVAELVARTRGRVGLAELLHALLPAPNAPPRAIDTATLGAVLDSLAPPARGEVPLSTRLVQWAQEPFSLERLLPSLARVGIRVEKHDRTHLADLGVFIDGAHGEVHATESGGAFARAGVQLGDRLLTLDGTAVTQQLLTAISRRGEERALPLEIERLGKRVLLTLRPRALEEWGLRVDLEGGDASMQKQRARVLETP